MGRHTDGFTPEAPQVTLDLAARVRLAARDDDLRPRGHVAFRERAADPAGSAGDDHHSVRHLEELPKPGSIHATSYLRSLFT
jgi:hypothetical protein